MSDTRYFAVPVHAGASHEFVAVLTGSATDARRIAARRGYKPTPADVVLVDAYGLRFCWRVIVP